MKKILLSILLICSIAFSAHAMPPAIIGGAGEGVATTGCAGFGGNYCQDFEGAGEPANWATISGTPDYDKSTSGLSMEQDKCLELTSGEHASYDPSYNNTDDHWTFYIRINDGFEANENTIFVRNSTGSNIGIIAIIESSGSNYFRCIPNGGTSVTGGTVFAAGATRKAKVRVIADTGADDATITLWLWGGSSWSQECTSNDGTEDGNIDRIHFDNNTDAEIIYIDLLKDDTSDITSPD